MNEKNNQRVLQMAFSSVYPHYLNKVERKGRTMAELHQVIFWLTGYDEPTFKQCLENKVDIKAFFNQAPAYHPHAHKITGVICGIRVEAIQDPLMQKIRQLDKLVDELAKGKAMGKILRA